MMEKILNYFAPSIKAWLAFIVAWTIERITLIQQMDLAEWTELAAFFTEIFKGFSFIVAIIFSVLQIIKFLKKKKGQ